MTSVNSGSENVGISQHESMTSELTALKIQAEEFQRQTAKFDPIKKRWMVCMPRINDELESHRMTDNTKRAVAMHYKVLQRTKPEYMPLLIKAHEDLVEQGFSEKIPDDELNPDHPCYTLISRPVFRLSSATTQCRIIINPSMPDQNDELKSLNKLLMAGPNKLPQIMELIMRLIPKRHTWYQLR